MLGGGPYTLEAAEGTYNWVWGGGGGTDDGACVSTHALVGSGGMFSPEKFLKLGALRSLLRPYIYIYYISFGCSLPVLSVGASWQRFA